MFHWFQPQDNEHSCRLHQTGVRLPCKSTPLQPVHPNTHLTLFYQDPSVIGAFLDNQDLPRFNSLTNDKSLVYNAITGTFLYGGIPAIYYGLEQDIADGPADPANREALWLYNGYSTTATPTYARIAMLNKIRTTLGKDENWLKSVGSVLASQDSDIAIKRGELVMVLTNVSVNKTV